MKNKKNFIKFITTTLVLTLALTFCIPQTTEAAQSPKLNKTTLYIHKNSSGKITLKNANKKVTWTVYKNKQCTQEADKSVIKISPSGNKKKDCQIKSKGKKKTVYVQAKCGNKSYVCKVIVIGKHDYKSVKYVFSNDYKKCIASKACKAGDYTKTKTLNGNNISHTVVKEATCAANGSMQHKADFSKWGMGVKTITHSTPKEAHKYNAPSYSWASDLSTCTASKMCNKCNNKVSETVNATDQETTAPKKNSKGVRTYTASFKDKSFSKQTKTKDIPMIAYLDKTSVSVKKGESVTIKLYNDTIKSLDSQDAMISAKKIDGNTIRLTTEDELGNTNSIITVETTNGNILTCEAVSEFVPGEYKIGPISTCYIADDKAYYAYGKLKGTYGDSAYYYYTVDCKTKEDYLAAKNTYEHHKMYNGNEETIGEMVGRIENGCYERKSYESIADLEWKSLSSSEKESLYNDNIDDYYKIKYGDDGYKYEYLTGYFAFNKFPESVHSDNDVKAIVDAWKAVSGETPSWYYPTVYSEWAEWTGRDMGLN